MRFVLLIIFVVWHVVCSNAIMNNKHWNYKLARKEWRAFLKVGHSVRIFAPNFYQILAGSKSGNVVCSPISAHMLMSMATYGTRGETEKQLRNALALPWNDISIGFRKMINSFDEYTKVELHLANKMYLSDSFEPYDKFRDLTEIAFHAEAETLDFHNAIKAAKTINDWCEAQTHHQIKDVIDSADLASQTAMVLVSAVYFKGNWETKFERTQTTIFPFNVDSKTAKNIPTMFIKNNFTYGELPSIDAKFVELPYKHEGFSDSISMIIILPNKIEGLDDLEKNIHKVRLIEFLLGTEKKVALSLPKFKIQSEISLVGIFQQMNVTNVFHPSADFTRITDKPSLSIDKIVQKVFIEVNEEGSEASAVSTMQMDFRSGGPGGFTKFLVNHPFMIIITTKGENPVPLFIGRYKGPENTDSES